MSTAFASDNIIKGHRCVPHSVSADDFGLRIFLPWIIFIDAVIEKDAEEMVDLMLQADGRIPLCPDADEIFAEQVIAGHRDAGMAVDKSLVFLDDGQAAFALRQIGILH